MNHKQDLPSIQFKNNTYLNHDTIASCFESEDLESNFWWSCFSIIIGSLVSKDQEIKSLTSCQSQIPIKVHSIQLYPLIMLLSESIGQLQLGNNQNYTTVIQ